MSKASDIAGALSTWLSAITVAGGYSTNIGQRVYRGMRKMDTNNLPCAVLVESEDTPTASKDSKVKLKQRYIVEGHDTCDPANPNDKALAMIADIKKAIFSPGTFPGAATSMTYIGRTIEPREDGTNIVGAAVEIEVSYTEDLAAP